MEIGGIETAYYNICSECIKNGSRVIWMRPKGVLVNQAYQDIFNEELIEIYDLNMNSINAIAKTGVVFNENEYVVALSTTLFSFLQIEKYRKSNKNITLEKFNNILWIPHFKGKAVFLEEFLPNPLRIIAAFLLSYLYRQMDINGNILYGSPKHLTAMEQAYHYTSTSSSNKMYKNTYKYSFKGGCYTTNSYNILTVSRFDFPHKGYLIGLVEKYMEICLKFPQKKFSLIIIGYGDVLNTKRLYDKISALPTEIRKMVRIIGPISPDQLATYYERAFVFVGLAGALSDAAKFGLISIPVRHYSFSCESYGITPDVDIRKNIINDAPGNDLMIDLCKLMSLSEDEYNKASLETYACFNHNAVKLLDFWLSLKCGKKTLNEVLLYLMLLMGLYGKKIRAIIKGIA